MESVIHIILHYNTPVCSFTARAISPDSDVFNIIGMGRDLDNATLSSSREEFIKGFCSVTGLSQDPQDGLEFGDVVWLGKYEPNIRMVATFRAGRILIAGGKKCATFAMGQGY